MGAAVKNPDAASTACRAAAWACFAPAALAAPEAAARAARPSPSSPPAPSPPAMRARHAAPAPRASGSLAAPAEALVPASIALPGASPQEAFAHAGRGSRLRLRTTETCGQTAAAAVWRQQRKRFSTTGRRATCTSPAPRATTAPIIPQPLRACVRRARPASTRWLPPRSRVGPAWVTWAARPGRITSAVAAVPLVHAWLARRAAIERGLPQSTMCMWIIIRLAVALTRPALQGPSGMAPRDSARAAA